MAAHESLNGNQFQYTMFEPAGKLADPTQTRHGDLIEGQRPEDLQAKKLERSQRKGWNEMNTVEADYNNISLHESIQNRGVVEPVRLFKGVVNRTPQLVNGHHRVFAANDINPQMEIPVRWH